MALGIDPLKEEDMRWIAEEAFNAPLPPGWSEHQDERGRLYFHNRATGKSEWRHPMFGVFKEVVTYQRQVVVDDGFWNVEDEIASREEAIRRDLADWTELYNERTEKFFHNRVTDESSFNDPRVEKYHEHHVRIKMIVKLRERLPQLAQKQRPTAEELTAQERYLKKIIRIQSFARAIVAKNRMKQLIAQAVVQTGPQPLRGKFSLQRKRVKAGQHDVVLAQTATHRRDKAATKMQSRVRGMLARKRFRPLVLQRQKLNKLVTKVQQRFRILLAKRKVARMRFARKLRAAVQVQRIFRGFKDRKFSKVLMIEKARFDHVVKNVIVIQSGCRMRLARKRANYIRNKRSIELIKAQARTFLAQRLLHEFANVDCPIYCRVVAASQAVVPFHWQMLCAPATENGTCDTSGNFVDLFSKVDPEKDIDFVGQGRMEGLQMKQYHVVAIVKVQAMVRGALYRGHKKDTKAFITGICRKIETAAYNMLARRKHAATQIQKIVRGRQIRKMDIITDKMKQFLERNVAGVKLIQSYFRKASAQQWLTDALNGDKRAKAATVIQAHWRGQLARARVEKLREAEYWPLETVFEFNSEKSTRDGVQMQVRFVANPVYNDFKHFVRFGDSDDMTQEVEFAKEEDVPVDEDVPVPTMKPEKTRFAPVVTKSGAVKWMYVRDSAVSAIGLSLRHRPLRHTPNGLQVQGTPVKVASPTNATLVPENAPETTTVPKLVNVPETEAALVQVASPETKTVPKLVNAPETEAAPMQVAAPETKTVPKLVNAPETKAAPVQVAARETKAVPMPVNIPEAEVAPMPVNIAGSNMASVQVAARGSKVSAVPLNAPETKVAPMQVTAPVFTEAQAQVKVPEGRPHVKSSIPPKLKSDSFGDVQRKEKRPKGDGIQKVASHSVSRAFPTQATGTIPNEAILEPGTSANIMTSLAKQHPVANEGRKCKSKLSDPKKVLPTKEIVAANKVHSGQPLEAAAAEDRTEQELPPVRSPVRKSPSVIEAHERKPRIQKVLESEALKMFREAHKNYADKTPVCLNNLRGRSESPKPPEMMTPAPPSQGPVLSETKAAQMKLSQSDGALQVVKPLPPPVRTNYAGKIIGGIFMKRKAESVHDFTEVEIQECQADIARLDAEKREELRKKKLHKQQKKAEEQQKRDKFRGEIKDGEALEKRRKRKVEELKKLLEPKDLDATDELQKAKLETHMAFRAPESMFSDTEQSQDSLAMQPVETGKVLPRVKDRSQHVVHRHVHHHVHINDGDDRQGQELGKQFARFQLEQLGAFQHGRNLSQQLHQNIGMPRMEVDPLAETQKNNRRGISMGASVDDTAQTQKAFFPAKPYR